MEVKFPLPSPGMQHRAVSSCGGQWPHTGRGELAQAPAVPRPWHVPVLWPLVLALAWLEEQSQIRAGNTVLYLIFLLDSFNPHQGPCLVPCSHSHACGRGGWRDKTIPWGQAQVPLAPASGWNVSLHLQLGQCLSVLLNNRAPTPRQKLGNMKTQEHRGCLVAGLLQQTLGSKDIGVRKEGAVTR